MCTTDDVNVPRGCTRSLLADACHIINPSQFNRSRSAEDRRAHLEEAFQHKLQNLTASPKYVLTFRSCLSAYNSNEHACFIVCVSTYFFLKTLWTASNTVNKCNWNDICLNYCIECASNWYMNMYLTFVFCFRRPQMDVPVFHIGDSN